jgi:hypothetical protein
MEHVSKIVEKKKLSDGQIAVLIQCCEDATHQGWHTLQVDSTITPDAVSVWLADRKSAVGAQHAAMLAADSALDMLQ